MAAIKRPYIGGFNTMQTYNIQNRARPYWFICRSFDTKREAVAELRALRAAYPADTFRLRRSTIDAIPCRAKRRASFDY
jgi:ribulose bisphosphate carboxylase small subunit